MIALLLATLAAGGTYLMVWSERRSDRSPIDLRTRVAARGRLLLDQAGLDGVSLVQFLLASALVGAAAAIPALVLFGVGLPAMLVAGAGAVVPATSWRSRRAARRRAARAGWPRLIEELRVLTGSAGRSIPQALLEVGLRGPEELHSAFASAQREWALTTDFPRTVAELKRQLADPTADATCETLLVAADVGGDLDARLAALAEDRRQTSRGAEKPKHAPVGSQVRPGVRDPRAHGHGSRRPERRGRPRRLSDSDRAGARRCGAARHGWLLVVGQPCHAAPRAAKGVRPMMLPIAWVLLALGFTFVLGEAPWFRRAGVVDRLAPYRRHRPTDPTRRTSESIRAVLAPGIERWGERASSMLGVRQQLSTRLEQAGWSVDPTSFRMRQAAFAGVTFVAGAAFTVALTPRPVVAVVAIVGLPLLAALIEERRLDSAVEERRSRRQEELPVVTEQLGLLLSAGYSVPSALNRLAQRGDGTIASDLRAVSRRIRQGLSTNAARGMGRRQWSRRDRPSRSRAATSRRCR